MGKTSTIRARIEDIWDAIAAGNSKIPMPEWQKRGHNPTISSTPRNTAINTATGMITNQGLRA